MKRFSLCAFTLIFFIFVLSSLLSVARAGNRFYFPEGLGGCPGDTVVIPVWGRNDVELKGYSVCMKFDPDVIEVDTLTLAGTRGEGAAMFTPGWTDTTAKAGVVYVYSCPGIPPDSGVILNLVMHIKDDAPIGVMLLDLVDVDPAKNRMTPCEGSVVTPTLIDGSFEVVEPLPDIFISPGSLDFGYVLCKNSSVDTFTIYSLGTGTLKVDSMLTPAGFTTDVDTATLPPGDSIVVTVTFAPIDTGFYDGQIKVFSNDPDPAEVPTIVDVSGRGIRYDVGPRMFFGPDTLYPNVPDSVLIRIYNFGNLTAENILVTGWLEPDSVENETTFVIPTLAAGDSIGYDLKLLFSDSLPCTYVAHICTDLDVDSDSTNNCAQDSFYYTEVKENWHELRVPSHYFLSQNYPNPFNPVTEIRYALPAISGQQTAVRLEVYNNLGEKVATLVDETQSPGYKAVTWDAKDVGSGVYFYRLRASVFVQTRKMVVIR